MKTKALAVLIILFSLLSWILWTVIVLEIYPRYLEQYKWFKMQIPTAWVANKVDNTTTTSTAPSQVIELENNIINIAKKISSSVVSIIIKKDLIVYKRDPWGFFQTPVGSVKRKIWWGSGFFVTWDGIIMTNKHVISDPQAEYTIIASNGKEYSAKAIALDPITDLALLKISNENWAPVEWMPTVEFIEDSNNVNIWQFVVAIWYALAEFQNTVTLWVISWKDRSIEIWNGQALSWLYQTDTAINPWNSWGPLVTVLWKVVWINTAIVSESNWVWFAIPLSKKRIDYILDSVSKHWKIRRPFIGVSHIPLSPAVSKELWLSIDYWNFIPNEEGSIVKWSSAEKAWLRGWDIIIEADWVKLQWSKNLKSALQNKIPWDSIKLKIIRDWVKRNLDLVLWEY